MDPAVLQGPLFGIVTILVQYCMRFSLFLIPQLLWHRQWLVFFQFLDDLYSWGHRSYISCLTDILLQSSVTHYCLDDFNQDNIVQVPMLVAVLAVCVFHYHLVTAAPSCSLCVLCILYNGLYCLDK